MEKLLEGAEDIIPPQVTVDRKSGCVWCGGEGDSLIYEGNITGFFFLCRGFLINGIFRF